MRAEKNTERGGAGGCVLHAMTGLIVCERRESEIVIWAVAEAAGACARDLTWIGSCGVYIV